MNHSFKFYAHFILVISNQKFSKIHQNIWTWLCDCNSLKTKEQGESVLAQKRWELLALKGVLEFKIFNFMNPLNVSTFTSILRFCDTKIGTCISENRLLYSLRGVFCLFRQVNFNASRSHRRYIKPICLQDLYL